MANPVAFFRQWLTGFSSLQKSWGKIIEACSARSFFFVRRSFVGWLGWSRQVPNTHTCTHSHRQTINLCQKVVEEEEASSPSPSEAESILTHGDDDHLCKDFSGGGERRDGRMGKKEEQIDVECILAHLLMLVASSEVWRKGEERRGHESFGVYILLLLLRLLPVHTAKKEEERSSFAQEIFDYESLSLRRVRARNPVSVSASSVLCAAVQHGYRHPLLGAKFESFVHLFVLCLKKVHIIAEEVTHSSFISSPPSNKWRICCLSRSNILIHPFLCSLGHCRIGKFSSSVALSLSFFGAVVVASWNDEDEVVVVLQSFHPD